MAATTFTWKPSYGASKTVTPVVRVIKFGDGYEQRQASGINRQPRKFAIRIKDKASSIATIEAYLAARGGIEAFNYTHPGQAAGVFVCREWQNANTDFGIDELSATFEEVFE